MTHQAKPALRVVGPELVLAKADTDLRTNHERNPADSVSPRAPPFLRRPRLDDAYPHEARGEEAGAVAGAPRHSVEALYGGSRT